MSKFSDNRVFKQSHLVWTTTPVAYIPPVNTAAISATAGILVYKDVMGDVRQVVDAEFQALPLMYVEAAELLTSGTITAGAGTGSSVTTTAVNVRAYW